MYKRFTLESRKTYHAAFVDGKKVCNITNNIEDWIALFTAIGVPEKAHERLYDYKRMLHCISYHIIHKLKGKSPLKAPLALLAYDLIAEFEDIDRVLINLQEGEVLT